MSERKICLWTVGCIILAIFSVAVITYFFSVFQLRSRRLFSGLNPRQYSSIILRNFEFDSAIVGSSLSQGSKCSVFDSVFGGRSMKFTYAGANLAEIQFTIEEMHKYRKIKRVVMDLPMGGLVCEQTLKQMPLDCYRGNFYFSYLKKSFTINELIRSLNFFRRSLTGKIKYTTRDDIYDWNKRHACSEKNFARDLLYNPYKKESFDGHALQEAERNVKTFLLQTFRNYPECEFLIFFPPFSMMYYRNVDLDSYVRMKRMCVDMLLNIPNVKIYDFETDFTVMQNFNNYKDLTHYSGKINSYLLSEMGKDRHRMTAENKEKMLSVFLNGCKNYNYTETYNRLQKTYGKK